MEAAMIDEADLRMVGTTALLACYPEEPIQIRTDDIGDDRLVMELTRRAVVGHDDAAWAELQALFGRHVAGWCRRSGAPEDDLEELTQITWVKFWQNYTPAKFAVADGIAQVLQYLKLCARSAVLDATRRQPAVACLDVDLLVIDPSPTPDEEHLAFETSVALWQVVEAHLHDERERVLVRLTYGLGLKSAEVQAHRPDLFPSVQDVYRLTRNVLDRLRRSERLRDWFTSESAPRS
jgi:RNA polymerase sigma factor (sigma-70 family)